MYMTAVRGQHCLFGRDDGRAPVGLLSSTVISWSDGCCSAGLIASAAAPLWNGQSGTVVVVRKQRTQQHPVAPARLIHDRRCSKPGQGNHAGSSESMLNLIFSYVGERIADQEG